MNLSLAKPCQYGRLEIERGCPARLQLRRYDQVRETAATYLSFRTLTHGIATVNTHTPLYFEVYGRTRSHPSARSVAALEHSTSGSLMVRVTTSRRVTPCRADAPAHDLLVGAVGRVSSGLRLEGNVMITTLHLLEQCFSHT